MTTLSGASVIAYSDPQASVIFRTALRAVAMAVGSNYFVLKSYYAN
jgi:hypothetical protein